LKIDAIDVDSAINSVKELLGKEKDLSPALRSALEVLLILVSLLLNRISLNSKNSSKPPSTDPNRKRSGQQVKSARKPGGQQGRNGTTLQAVDDPDEVKVLEIDRRTLPKGSPYREVGHEIRQVIDIDISRFVTEYRAQILEDSQGKRWVALFPEGVNQPVQYGLSLKANAVYMSQHQLIPYDRVRDHFQDQMHIAVSAGSVFNFNQEEPMNGWDLLSAG
jgi:transposase